MMGPHGHLRAVEGTAGDPYDNVARWRTLAFQYPQAVYTFKDGWFTGALRDEDDVMRATDLGRLIDRLMARENGRPV
jgi:hypothetical protein